MAVAVLTVAQHIPFVNLSSIKEAVATIPTACLPTGQEAPGRCARRAMTVAPTPVENARARLHSTSGSFVTRRRHENCPISQVAHPVQ